MTIDLFVLAAQVVNFLLLAWFLKVVLYDRVLAVMAERDRREAAARVEAERLRAEAVAAREEFERQRRELEERSGAMLEAARAEAERARNEGMEEARREVEESRAEWRALLEREREALVGAFRRRAAGRVHEAARRALAELANADLERRMTAVFLQRLDTLPPADRDALRVAAGSGEAKGGVGGEGPWAGRAGVVRSAFAVPADDQAAIAAAVRRVVGVEVPLRYETDPDLVAGLQLDVGGRRVNWNAADYLAALAERWEDVFREGPDRE